MFSKNNLYLGIVVALIFPAAAFITATLLNTNLYLMNKPALPYFAAIAANLILLRIFYKNGADKTSRGIMLATFVLMLAIFLFKVHVNR